VETVRSKIFKGHDPYANFQPIGYDLQGWASSSPCFEESIKELQPKLIVEVGTWKGASAVHMARICKKYYTDFEIVCIDTFLGSVEHWTSVDPNLPASRYRNGRPNIYDQFISNVIITKMQENITPFPIDSINGGLVLEKLGIQADLIYIDAGHEYQSVRMDLDLYKNLVRPGGHMLGDDWFHPPIKKAVADSLGEVITKSHDKFLWVKP
jgi:hypothetical protein